MRKNNLYLNFMKNNEIISFILERFIYLFNKQSEMPKEINLICLKKPNKIDLMKDIEWLGNSFKFTQGRDTKNISTKILQCLLHEISKKGNASTEKISIKLKMPIQKVNYHLRTFISSGFIYREKKFLYIQQGSIKNAIEEMRKDANRLFDTLLEVGSDIDHKLGFKNR
jgi:predicted transcriptional regulator